MIGLELLVLFGYDMDTLFWRAGGTGEIFYYLREQLRCAFVPVERSILYHAQERLPASHTRLAILDLDDDRLGCNFTELPVKYSEVVD
jgi:hypothetical protein